MQLLNIHEAAKELRLHATTVRRMIKNGGIPHHRIGKKILFTPSDLETFLEQSSRQAEGVSK
jgi:excisionase family DNA binding protein